MPPSIAIAARWPVLGGSAIIRRAAMASRERAASRARCVEQQLSSTFHVGINPCSVYSTDDRTWPIFVLVDARALRCSAVVLDFSPDCARSDMRITCL